MAEKIFSMKEAIARFIEHGDAIVMGDIIENTGWDLKLATHIETTKLPTKSELKIIRKNGSGSIWEGYGEMINYLLILLINS